MKKQNVNENEYVDPFWEVYARLEYAKEHNDIMGIVSALEELEDIMEASKRA